MLETRKNVSPEIDAEWAVYFVCMYSYLVIIYKTSS
jgi:hypothetical protein